MQKKKIKTNKNKTKKKTANDARLRSRNSTVSVKARQPSVWLQETQLSRDANIKKLFMYILNNSDILFSFETISVCKCILRCINTSYFIFFSESW